MSTVVFYFSSQEKWMLAGMFWTAECHIYTAFDYYYVAYPSCSHSDPWVYGQMYNKLCISESSDAAVVHVHLIIVYIPNEGLQTVQMSLFSAFHNSDSADLKNKE